MSEITIECNVTEHSVTPPIEYEKVVFCLNKECIVISFMDDEDNVLTQSEIDKKDAIDLATLILLRYDS